MKKSAARPDYQSGPNLARACQLARELLAEVERLASADGSDPEAEREARLWLRAVRRRAANGGGR